MVDISKVPRIAGGIFAYTYLFNNAETELLGEKINGWYHQQLFQHDPCHTAEIAISLTEATNLEVPGFAGPQYGHVLIMVFGDEVDGRVKTHVSELFLRVSERGVIVEICPFRPTVH